MRRAPFLAVALLLAACTGAPSEGPPPIIRLVDRLEEGVVEASPLTTLPPDDELLATVAETEVFADDFESGGAADYRWPEPQEPPPLRPLAGGGRGWCWSDRTRAPAAILLPALPGRRYRVERTLLAAPEGPDLQVVERMRVLDDTLPFNPPDAMEELRTSRLRDLLTIHHFPPASPGEASTDHVDVLTSPATSSLMILFDQAATGARGGKTRSCVDALRVVRLETTPEQELAFARAAGRGAGPWGDLGFVKRGQLLPLPAFAEADPPVDRNLDHVDALFAPTPTTFRFPLDVPEAARLTFRYALGRGAAPGDEASFSVVLEAGGQTTSLFQERAAVGEGQPLRTWRDGTVDLSPWSGRQVVLRLVTRGRETGTPVPALWGAPIVERPRRPDEPPNVLLIGLDTLRADRLSSYGYGRPTTPHLDALAAEGVRFDQAVSTAPWTAPSFASIFTGRMPSAHGVVDRLTGLAGELETVTERFRAGGWRTQGYAFKPFLFNLGFEQGFDDWFNVPRLDRTGADSVEKALGFLDRHGDARFFLFLHFDDPHEPLRQPEPWDTRFTDGEELARFGLELPANIGLWPSRGCDGCRDENGVTPEYARAAGALYDGAVSFMDDRLGHLFEELRRRGLWDDTVIAVVSDHGETLWDRADRFGHGNSVAEELVRAVLIVKPARRRGPRGGRVVAQQVSLADLAPTLLELAGLEAFPAGPDSRTLVPLMEGRGRAVGSPFAVSENPRTGMLGVRHEGWKYVTVHRPGLPARERLYDLRQDPRELRSAMPRRPEMVPPLREQLTEHVLRNRRGRYLVALGGAEQAAWSLDLSAAGELPAVMSFFGLAPRGQRSTGRFEGFTAGPVVGLLEVAAPVGAATWQAVLRGAGGAWDVSSATPALEARPELLATLERRGPGLYLVESTAGVEADAVAAESAENLEQLRALGYVD
ncbi:MAG: sulfatase [Thermoanaerobaculia bacterium]